MTAWMYKKFYLVIFSLNFELIIVMNHVFQYHLVKWRQLLVSLLKFDTNVKVFLVRVQTF